jgi:predicted phosphoadenosine phosphosulfate sulfurtransferase
MSPRAAATHMPNRDRQPKQRTPRYPVAGLNVFDAALQRIRWLFDEFDGNVVVHNSGGKDSTVIVELAARVARERGDPPVRVAWLDQECEFSQTVAYQRHLAYEREDIDFRWYQVPFLLENSTSHDHGWVKIWDQDLGDPPPLTGPGSEQPFTSQHWVRAKEATSIQRNTFGEDYFYELLAEIAAADPGPDGCVLDGIRGDESPARLLTCTSHPMYKWATWSAWPKAKPHPTRNPLGRSARRFHPIWDWRHQDVWHAIEQEGWRYNTFYDELFRYGIAPRNMRVSNFHHASALHALTFLQEVDPVMWERATMRLTGISTFGRLNREQYPKRLPYMFASWVEYMHYLIDNLVTDPNHQLIYRKLWRTLHNTALDRPVEKLAKVMVYTVITNDFYGVHVKNFLNAPAKDRGEGPVPPRALLPAPTTRTTVEVKSQALVHK